MRIEPRVSPASRMTCFALSTGSALRLSRAGALHPFVETPSRARSASRVIGCPRWSWCSAAPRRAAARSASSPASGTGDGRPGADGLPAAPSSPAMRRGRRAARRSIIETATRNAAGGTAATMRPRPSAGPGRGSRPGGPSPPRPGLARIPLCPSRAAPVNAEFVTPGCLPFSPSSPNLDARDN
jgi:hypothetical protein